MEKSYDVIVIGAGSGGLTAAAGLRKIGKTVLLIEREHIGGECTNTGCIPSKALLHHARSFYHAQKVSGNNERTEEYRLNAFNYVRDKINETLATETQEHLIAKGIDFIYGEAIFTGPKEISVDGLSYTFKKAIIATGSSPKIILIPGIATADILTNQNIFSLSNIPNNTLIIGAGPIGLELGQALAMLGSKVTILDNNNTFANLEDSAIRPIIKNACTELGITIIQKASITSILNRVANIISTSNTSPLLIKFDKILLAIGRTPNIPAGLKAANITNTEFGINVNGNYQTTNKRVYALGDVADKMKFTHVADDIARQVVTHIATFGLTPIKNKAIPKVTYTEPEMAQVGLSQEIAERTFGSNVIHRIEVPFATNDRAQTDETTQGVLVVIVKRITGEIIGAHIIGARAGELISIFTLAIDNRLSLWKLRRTIYAYPTYSILIKKAGDYFFAQQISTLKLDLIYKIKKLIPKLLLGTIWIIGLFLLYQYLQQSNQNATDITIRLFNIINLTSWGPLLYIAAYTIRPITFIPGTVLTVLSGVFFGLWGGIIYTIIGANLSATTAYFLGKFFGKNTNNYSPSLFGRFATACRNNPFNTILTMRLIFLPYDGVNYGAGLLKVPYIPFILATITGTLLGIITFVALGASLSVAEFIEHGVKLNNINPILLIFSVTIFLTSLLVAKLLKQK